MDNLLYNINRHDWGMIYMGPGKYGTGPLWDLNGSVPKRSHESSPKLFQIARPFTWDWIIHWIARITAVFVEGILWLRAKVCQKSGNIEECIGL